MALWIIGEYAHSKEDVQNAFAVVKRNVGSLPVYPKPTDEEEEVEEQKEEVKDAGPKVVTKTVVLADGSYGT